MRYRYQVAISSDLFIDGRKKGKEKIGFFSGWFGMTFQVGSQKIYLRAYHLLTESEQAAWLSNSCSLLSV